MTLALTSDTLALSKVEDLADTMLAQKISQLSGVGLVSIAGGQKPAVRIQANPTALASYGLRLEDLRTALGTANVDQAKGNLNGATQAYTIGANDQLLSSADYNKVIIAYRNGSPGAAVGCGERGGQRGEPLPGGVDGDLLRSRRRRREPAAATRC